VSSNHPTRSTFLLRVNYGIRLSLILVIVGQIQQPQQQSFTMMEKEKPQEEEVIPTALDGFLIRK